MNPTIRKEITFLLCIPWFVALLYVYCTWRDMNPSMVFAKDFQLFHAIGQQLSWPPPDFAQIYDLRMGQDWLAHTRPDYFPYLYLPHFLPLLAPLHHQPLLASYAVWMGALMIAYIALMLRLRPAMIGPEAEALQRITGYSFGALILCAAVPHLVHLVAAGHPSIVAALLVYAGFQSLEKRPALSGILFALATYKPQMALMLPVLLLAGRHWRAWWAFCAMGLLLFLLGSAAFGWEVWPRYLAMLAQHGTIMLEMPARVQNQTMGVFAALRLLGMGNGWAGALQLLCALGTLGLLGLAAHRRASLATLVLLVAAPFLISPYVMLYDSIMLVPGIAALILAEAVYPPSQSRRIAIMLLCFLPLSVVLLQAKGIPIACPTLLWMAAEAIMLLRQPAMPERVMPESHAALIEK